MYSFTPISLNVSYIILSVFAAVTSTLPTAEASTITAFVSSNTESMISFWNIATFAKNRLLLNLYMTIFWTGYACLNLSSARNSLCPGTSPRKFLGGSAAFLITATNERMIPIRTPFIVPSTSTPRNAPQNI